MRRRGFLSDFASVLAGCTGSGSPEDTPTPKVKTVIRTRKSTDRATSTAMPRPTETSKSTPVASQETPTNTPSVTSTPTATDTPTQTPVTTPSEFQSSIEDIRELIKEMYTTYLEQGEDAESLDDVDASVTEFEYGKLNGPNGDAGDRIIEARDLAEKSEQQDLIGQLDNVRSFIWKAAQTQERLGNAYEQLETLYEQLDDEETSAAEESWEQATIHEFRGARSNYRDTEDQAEKSDLESVDFFDESEYTDKLDQFDAEVDTIADLKPPLELFVDGVDNLASARHHNDQDRKDIAEARADEAIEDLETTIDDLEELLRDDVAESMERLIEDFSELADRKRQDATAIAN